MNGERLVYALFLPTLNPVTGKQVLVRTPVHDRFVTAEEARALRMWIRRELDEPEADDGSHS